MERATHPVEEHEAVEEHHGAEPIPRDPDLPTVSDATLMLFAAAALVATVVGLLILL